MRTLFRIVDCLIDGIGHTVAWLVALLTVVLSYEVFMRYLFGSPTAWAYDVSYMLGGTFFILGAGYTLLRQKHVRVDIIYNRFSARTQALIDVILGMVFFFPVWIGIFYRLFPYVINSWLRGERTLESFWRPPVYPFKTMMLIGVFLLLLAGLKEFIRSLTVLLGKSS